MRNGRVMQQNLNYICNLVSAAPSSACSVDKTCRIKQKKIQSRGNSSS